MISYELALGLSLVGVLLLSGSLSLRDIVDSQSGTGPGRHACPPGTSFRRQFVAFFIYLMAAFAETNRIPFDLPEAETELVAGYHTEYSSMKFAMFFMAEYAQHDHRRLPGHAAVFWRMARPGIFDSCRRFVQALLPVFWFALKVFFFSFSIYGCAARCRASAMTS